MSVDDLVIDVRNASVRYRVPHERIPTFKEFAIRWLRGRIEWREFQALTDVTLGVRRGERVGIIGRNGAGKTTLLKVIARVLRPRTGAVRTHGRIVPLLELGAGFDPELSGRENILLNGSMLGHSRRYMQARIPAIVAFAGLEEFINAPLRTYSTGMVARLGFAIATDVEPDVLLLDEVLSVGDVVFQQKCMTRMAGFRAAGATFLFVSHSMGTVLELCERAIWIEAGRIRQDGPAPAVVAAFEAAMGMGVAAGASLAASGGG
ncbi:MAG TPA: ABC transporter ATP-binding protein [Candidatus Binatia bacterium]|nr:ABC transporter ATP-binding protein [Candidatus Binatia bacterium]